MTMTHEDLLAAYAAGSTSPGLSLLCAAHLTLSPKGRDYVSLLEEVGGALMLDLEATADHSSVSTGELTAGGVSFDALLAEIDADEVTARPVPNRNAAAKTDAGPLPRPVSRALGRHFDDIPWKARLPYIAEHILFEEGGEKVSLMRARPGARVPDHTHHGDEATLVMSGMMRDGDRILTPGDIALCGPEHDHHPEILGDETCYCLIVVDGKLRFNGALGRALNLFAE